MLTKDVRLEGFTTRDWSRLLGLFEPRQESEPGKGGLLVVHDAGRIRKLLHMRTGRLPAGGVWPVPLPELAKEHDASWALSAHMGALEEVMERFGARVRRHDDITSQSLIVLGIVREMMAEGAIAMWPPRLRGVPPPTEGVLRRTLDGICHDGRAVAFGMFKDEELYTAFIARRRGSGFDVIAGPDELRPAMGLLSGDWRRDYRHLVRAVEDRYAPLSLGCFAEQGAFRELLTDARPGAWSRAVAVRDVVLSPIPTAVVLALGVDSARFAWGHAKVRAEALNPIGLFEPLVKSMRAKFLPPGETETSPLAALRALLRR